MREIKFRAWDGELMHNVDELHFPVGGMHWFGPGVGKGWARECPVMQYTGLKDKNGVEIYEGDVIQYIETRSCKCPKCENEQYTILNQGEVVIVEGMTKHNFIPNGEFYTLDDSWQWEVIGNIYENPGLISE